MGMDKSSKGSAPSIPPRPPLTQSPPITLHPEPESRSQKLKKRRMRRSMEESTPPTDLSCTGSSRRDRVLQHDQLGRASGSTRTNDMSEHLQYETLSGALLTCTNAGNVLSRYIQSFGNPTQFRTTTTYTIISPFEASAPPEKKLKQHKAVPEHQPPPGSTFHCTVTLPPCTGLASASSSTAIPQGGPGLPSKLSAKRVAHLAAVKALIENGEIDADFNPTPRTIPSSQGNGTKMFKADKVKRLLNSRPPLREYEPGIESELTPEQRWEAFETSMTGRSAPKSSPIPAGQGGVATYDHITVPSFFLDSPPLASGELYATLLQLRLAAPHDGRNGECRVLCLVTSRPLPILGKIGEEEVDVSHGEQAQGCKVKASVRLVRNGKMKKWDEGKLKLAVKWTQRMMRAQLNKPLLAEAGTAKWAVVPMVRGYELPASASRDGERGVRVRKRDIGWDEVAGGNAPLTSPFNLDDTAALVEQIDDAMISAKSEYSRRFYVTRLRHDLSPSSPDPKCPEKTLLEGVKTFGLTPVPPLQHPNQPMFECELSIPAKTGGFMSTVIFPDLTGHFSIPELNNLHVLTASSFRTASVLPMLFAALDDILIANQMNSTIFHDSLRPELALQAITCPTAKHTSPEKSYQRLEMLGDTLLKLISTMDMYLKASQGETDAMHTDRHFMVSNRSLKANAIDAGVVPYIRSAPTRVKLWKPHGWSVESADGEEKKEVAVKQHLGDKVVADVAEAIIGAAYLSADINPIDAAIATMHILRIPLQHIRTWANVAKLARTSPSEELAATKGVMPKNGVGAGHDKPKTEVAWMKAFKPMNISLLGHTFKDERRALMVTSLSSDLGRKARFHKSKLIGDALLDYFVVEDLWNRFPNVGPAALTHMKHSRVGDIALAAYCVVSGLLDRLRDVDAQVAPLIKKFKQSILIAHKEAEEAIKRGEEGLEWWSEVPQQNSLGDFAEAALGAICEDTSFDVGICRKVFERELKPFMERYCVGPHEHSLHPKSMFLEMIYARGCTKWDVRKLGESDGEYRTSVLLHGKELGKSSAGSPALATRKACEAALELIKKAGLEKLCDCPKKKSGKA